MMADTLAFQVSPSHLPDQPPKMTRQQVFKSKIQAESSLQHQETVMMVSCALCPLLCSLQGHLGAEVHMRNLFKWPFKLLAMLQAPIHQAVPG